MIAEMLASVVYLLVWYLMMFDDVETENCCPFFLTSGPLLFLLALVSELVFLPMMNLVLRRLLVLLVDLGFCMCKALTGLLEFCLLVLRLCRFWEMFQAGC